TPGKPNNGPGSGRFGLEKGLMDICAPSPWFRFTNDIFGMHSRAVAKERLKRALAMLQSENES
ncbi:MAG: hypothetical protein H6Q04_1171, partial [Acidobacteria bacterium]|nr:hypothetical protein [Acidobacteriota bacterium]